MNIPQRDVHNHVQWNFVELIQVLQSSNYRDFYYFFFFYKNYNQDIVLDENKRINKKNSSLLHLVYFYVVLSMTNTGFLQRL